MTIPDKLALAMREHRVGNLAAAESVYREILGSQPYHADALHLLGVILSQTDRHQQAVVLLRRAVAANPGFAEARNNLGSLLLDLGELEEAAVHLDAALRLEPDFGTAHYNLGNVLKGQGKLSEAGESYRRAIRFQPDHAGTHNNLGSVLMEEGEPGEALGEYERAVELQPDLIEAHNNLGTALRELGHVNEALASYTKALLINPELADAHYNRGILRLLLGDFENGWADYEWRTDVKTRSPRAFNEPRWDGSVMPDETLLVHAEQGLGDTLQFIRFAAIPRQRVGRLVMLCQETLRPLLSNVKGIDLVVTDAADVPPFDFHIPLLSLPGLFGTNSESIPAHVPYLSADPNLVERWRTSLAELSGFRVGISWQGNPGYREDRLRSIPLRHFAPLAELSGLRLISLQKGHGVEQLQQVRGELEVMELDADFDETSGPFMDTAAVMKSLDLVVTSDTATAHLAGALGIPVWVALPLIPDWRWQLRRGDSPWYPTRRLFRQQRPGDWHEVFQRIRAALDDLIRRESARPGEQTKSRCETPARKNKTPASALESARGEPRHPRSETVASRTMPNTASRKVADRLALAMREHGAGKLDAAGAIYREILVLQPNHPDALHLLGVILYQTDRHQEAVDLLRQAVAANPSFAEARNNLGSLLLDLGNLDEATIHLEAALQLQPDFPEAHFNLGNVFNEQGKLNEAVASFRRSLQFRSDYVEAHNNLASALMDLGKLDEAVASYQRAVQLKPDFAEAHNNLGGALRDQGQLDEALASYQRALRLKPDFAEAHSNLGDVLRNQGQLDEAIASCQRAVQRKPDFAEAYNNLANVYEQTGQYDQALAGYQRALQLKPDYADAHANLGKALQGLGRSDEAVASLQRAIQLEPDCVAAYRQLANVLRQQKRLDEAVVCLRSVIKLKPDSADAHNNLGLALGAQGKPAEAESCYQRALQLVPDLAEAHNNLGGAYADQQMLDQAVASYQRAVRLKPDFAEAHYNLGATLKVQGKPLEAMARYDRAIKLQPNLAAAHLNRAILRLLLGDFDNGWAEYEWRAQIETLSPRVFDVPCWDGSELPDKTVLIHTEQGLGDTLQFVRFAPLVKARVGRVVLLCQGALRQLVLTADGVDLLVTDEDALPSFDFHVPMLSLPGILRANSATIPASVPYISADGELRKRWHDQLEPIAGFRVGISWQGNPAYKDDRFRSVPLVRFAPLAELSAVRLISLQKGHGVEQLEQARNRFEVLELSGLDETSGAFMDTAAVMKSLDLFVTSDSAVAHLAGALGVRTWLALPQVPDWRWLLYRDDSPWYPTMRLFRQRARGDWDGVFRRIRAALQDLILRTTA